MARYRAIDSILLVAGITGLLSGGDAVARLQVFQASWEQSSWQVEASPQQCALSHPIPRFGQARFEQRPGRRLEFRIVVDEPPVNDQVAQLHSQSLPWQHPAARRGLGDFRLQQGKTPLRIPRDKALRVFYELEQGMMPVLEFADWGDGLDQVQVSIVPVRFHEALEEFRQCTAGLLYLDFEPVAEETVLFATNSDRLTLTARRSLEAIALKYRRQPGFRLVLGGHADERGENAYNLDLSRRRAAAVAHYLRARGVSGAAIESRFFGELHPVDPERHEDAWARNRRVTVWLAESRS